MLKGSVRQDCIYFLTHEILKLICGRINYIVSILSAVLVKLT